MRLKIYGPEGYLLSSSFELLLAESEKAVEFMIPTPKFPTFDAN
jgi:hypothetical protein